MSALSAVFPPQCPAQLCSVMVLGSSRGPGASSGGRRRAPHSHGASEAAGTLSPSSASPHPQELPSRCSLPTEPSMPGGAGAQAAGGCPVLRRSAIRGHPQNNQPDNCQPQDAPADAGPPFSGLARSWIGGRMEIETAPPRGSTPTTLPLGSPHAALKRQTLLILAVTHVPARVTLIPLLSKQLRAACI